MAVKASTILYLVATILFAVAAAALGDKFPVVDLGLAFTAAGLTVGSVGK
jgi:hypothetical protein